MTTLNIADSKTENWSVSRSITDALWTLTAQLDKHATPAFFTKIKAVAKDHGGNDKTPFVGIFPGSDYIMAPVGDKATLTGYDYAWYLTTQYVPAFGSGTAWHTTDIATDPAETVRTLLGGDANWATVTGVKPFRMTADADWGTRQKVFEFDEKCTRWQAIQEIAEYCNYVFVVKPYYDSGDWYSYAYFIPEANIDNASPAGLDLPAMQTFTKPDAYLLPGTTIRDNPEKGFNRVKVTGYDETTQTYYYHTSESAGVGATPPTELAIEYFYASKDLNTQLKVDTRADELLAYFQASSKVYTAKLKQRLDLELYQKVRFADYDKIEGTTGVPVDMRITRISYHHAAVDDYVEIEFAKDQDAQQLQRLTAAVNPDSVMGMMSVIRDDMHTTKVLDQFDAPATLPYNGSGEMIDDLDVGGHDLLEIKDLHGRPGNWDLIFYGGDGASSITEMMRWDASEQNLNMAGNKIANLGAGTPGSSEAARMSDIAAGYTHPSARQCTTGSWAWGSISGKPSTFAPSSHGNSVHSPDFLATNGSNAMAGILSMAGYDITGIGDLKANSSGVGIVLQNDLGADTAWMGRKLGAVYLHEFFLELDMNNNAISHLPHIAVHTNTDGLQIWDSTAMVRTVRLASSTYALEVWNPVHMHDEKITNLGAPVAGTDAARLQDVTDVAKISNCTDTVKVDCKADCNIDITVPSGKVVTFIRS